MWHKNRAKRSITEDTSFITNQSPFKTISLMFRTVKPDGILIYAATNKHFTSVEVSNVCHISTIQIKIHFFYLIYKRVTL